MRLGEVGTNCVDDAARTAIQSKVFDRAAEAMGRHLNRYGWKLPEVAREARFEPPKLTEDFNWPKLVGGVYYPRDKSIRLNMKVLCDAESYEQTLAHEVAHSVTRQILAALYPGATMVPHRDPYYQPHGRGWSAIMHEMGYRPERRMSADIASAYPEKYAGMTCACGKKLNITRAKLARDQKRMTPGSFYLCRCGRHIEPSMFKGSMDGPPAAHGRLSARACARLRKAYVTATRRCESQWRNKFTTTRRGLKACDSAARLGQLLDEGRACPRSRRP